MIAENGKSKGHTGDMLKLINPVMDVQTVVADILRDEEWFTAHSVKIVEQNSQALAYLLRTKLDEMKGVSLIVGTDSMDNNYPARILQMTVTCTERVTINRAKQGFTTAIDACQAAIQMIDGMTWRGVENAFHFQHMVHESNREADLLRATATFSVMVKKLESC